MSGATARSEAADRLYVQSTSSFPPSFFLTLALGLAASLALFSMVQGWFSWTLLAVGLLITGVGATYVRVSVRRRYRLKAAELALKASEERYRRITETSPDAIYINRKGHIEFMNAAGLRLFGATNAEQVIGRPTLDLFPEKYHAAARDRVRSMKESGQPAPLIETQVRRFDGTCVDVEIAASPFEDQGEIAIQVTLRDITARKQAERALRENQAQLQTVLENLAEGVVVSALDGQLLYWNRAALTMHGFKSLDECQHRLPEFTETFELATMEGLSVPLDQWPLSRILRGEHLRDVELRVRRLNTDWKRIYSYAGDLVRDTDGRPLLAIISMSDITGRKHAEANLDRERERLRRMVDTAQVGVAFGSANGSIVEVNNVLLCMIGWTREEFATRGLKWRDITPTDCRDAIDQPDSSGTVEPFETTLFHRDGRRIPVLCNTASVRGPTGPEQVTFILDITAQRGLEAALQDVVEAEHGRIARDLHDGLGQQLGGVLYLSRMLQQDLEKISPSEASRAGHIHQLIRDAMELARNVTRGLHPVLPEPDGLTHALQSLCDWVAQSRNLRCDFACDPPVSLYDVRVATHLYRIAQEAVNNAMKHSAATWITIQLRQEDDSLVLRVCDNGVGLPARSATRGLGMRTMKHRSSLIGGHVTVRNGLEGGVQVVCRVPLTGRQPEQKTAAATS